VITANQIWHGKTRSIHDKITSSASSSPEPSFHLQCCMIDEITAVSCRDGSISFVNQPRS
jgi:hypothetical protein